MKMDGETFINEGLIQWEKRVKLKDKTFNFYFFLDGDGVFGVNAKDQKEAVRKIEAWRQT